MRRREKRIRRLARAALGAVLAPVFALVVAAILSPLPPELAARATSAESVRFYDRGGGLLREVRADDATRARWVTLDEIGPVATKAMLAAEDARFYDHPGVDPVAVARAAAQDARERRVVSGASTLTMQLARLVRPHPRTLRGKFGEAALALRIEWSLDKRRILEEYMNRAPFGEGLRGIDAASRFYFDKPPAKLSAAEAATLAAIPRGPHVYALTRRPERVLLRRDRILGRMRAALGEEQYARAIAEPLDLHLQRGSFGAPHLVQALVDGRIEGVARGARDVTTTIDRDLQREAEHATLATLRPLAARHVTAASVVVVENATGDVLAYVGSPDFGDAAHLGQNDGARAKRQPGSTLKPFVYGLAMERLGLDAASVLPDVELRIDLPGGTYAPLNYDDRFHGPVRLREALASSLNVPAVYVAHELGDAALLDRLHALGFASLREAPEYYGPAMALGDGEVTLLELANAYATLARGGVYAPLRFVASAPSAERRVMPERLARVVTDVLRDPSARASAFGVSSALDLPFDVAAKTGTSKGFRDNWTVGYTREVTVAVWVGNFDGAAMEGVSGITGAGPLFHAVMEAAARARPPIASLRAGGPDLEEVEVCPLSGGAPTRACAHTVREWVPRGAAGRASCTMHERVAIDVRNGLRAGPGCPRAFVEEKGFERFGGAFAAWAAGAGRATAPAQFSPLCPGDASAAGTLRIGYPHDGARFLIDPDRPRAQQTLAVRVEAPAGAPAVRLRVDGRVVASTTAPYVVDWPLAPGEHELVAEAPNVAASPPVHLRVD
jgi:penicillin-binding protein 1C